MVLDPVDGKAAEAIVNKAESQGVPVVSYDRLASGPVELLRLVRQRAGRRAAGPGAARRQVRPTVATIEQHRDDQRCADRSERGPVQGGCALGRSTATSTSRKEFDTPDWSPDKAQTEMQQAITATRRRSDRGVYSANDGMAAGIVAAMKSAGIDPLPLTGQDAQIDGIQRVLAGDQSMTIYKAIEPGGAGRRRMAVALIKGEDYADATESVEQRHGGRSVPAARPGGGDQGQRRGHGDQGRVLHRQ